jgi:hypothetical protein
VEAVVGAEVEPVVELLPESQPSPISSASSGAQHAKTVERIMNSPREELTQLV